MVFLNGNNRPSSRPADVNCGLRVLLAPIIITQPCPNSDMLIYIRYQVYTSVYKMDV